VVSKFKFENSHDSEKTNIEV